MREKASVIGRRQLYSCRSMKVFSQGLEPLHFVSFGSFLFCRGKAHGGLGPHLNTCLHCNPRHCSWSCLVLLSCGRVSCGWGVGTRSASNAALLSKTLTLTLLPKQRMFRFGASCAARPL